MSINQSHIQNIIAGASNIKGGANPPFTADDFRNIYPQFFNADKTPLVPNEVMEMYIQFAHSCVSAARYRDAWKVGISLFIAHFISLYMQSMVDPDVANVQTVMSAARTKGLVASKSVDGVSVSYDFSSALSDLDGWAAWKLTNYGLQFATMAKIYAIGGMYVR